MSEAMIPSLSVFSIVSI